MTDKPKQFFTALDIGTSKICAIIAEKTENNKLKIIGFSETESEGVSEGMIQNLIKATVKIKEVVLKASEMANLKIKFVNVGIAGKHIRSFSTHHSIGLQNKSIHNFGNPIRVFRVDDSIKSYEHFKLEKDKKTVLVLGGSLGAKSINDAIINNISLIRESSYQILWQTGKLYHDEIQNHNFQEKNLVIKSFIDRMDIAYSVADLIISRAGAIAISELCVVAKPLILIPSPNVVDDHQTKNALEISERGQKNTHQNL